ncbi:MAG: FAD-binding oxidoreductase [Ramlibacter sp.]
MSESELLGQLEECLGPTGLLAAEADMAGYSHDLSNARGGRVVGVARPASASEVADIVRLCGQAGVPITPRGGGTGLSGGATPVAGASLVLSFERMRTIRSIDPISNHIVVEAGVTLYAAQQAAIQAQRQLGLDHGGAGSSQIGGNLSTNAGGNNVIRYGMARDQVLGLEVVLADGRLLEFLSPLRKNNAGYDLKGVFLGSEGTLGLITAATLRLRPAAHSRATMLVGLQGIGAVMSFFERTQSAIGDSLTAVELIPRAAVEQVIKRFPDTREPFAQSCAWALLVEAECASQFFDLDAAMEDLFVHAQQAGEVVDGNFAASQAQRATFWTLRERIAHVMIESPICLKMDTAVPIARIPQFLEHATRATALALPGCRPIPFGHVGDGNIHFNVLGPEGMDATAFDTHRATLARAVEDCATALDGTVSAEHGIGLLKKDALVRMRSDAERSVMARIRSALDPSGLLNPGKVFDAS